DLVCGGPPCQPFSLGGLRQADVDNRNMIPEFVRCVRECEPEMFLMENVPGLVSKKTRPYFDETLEKFRRLGFTINWSILYAPDYGVPQKRRRLFVLGSRNRMLYFPKATHGPDADVPHPVSKDYISKVPLGDPPNSPVRYARSPDLRKSPYAGHIYNGGGRPIDLDAPCHTILASSGGYKTHWIDTEGIAPRYHAHLMNGGMPWEGKVPGARRLSTLECSIIQTFPEEMFFAGTRSSQYTQIGDAVPPRMAAALAESLDNQFRGIESELKPVDADATLLQGRLFV
ncbi:MAG: DNA cytosine methyltransferase, partial [Planctomycetaceae bacterium]|nr:DNA cytosine methyltransferase [Planctomycetaceae bacterium]